MPIAPRTPVLVGVGAVQQREDDLHRAREPLELMAAALEQAAADAGSHALLARADSVRAPRGLWDYPDPCRLLAERFGAARARTEVAEIGVLQTTLLGRAAADIARGDADVVLVVGAEDRWRAQRAGRAGVEPTYTRGADVAPDVVLRPEAPILHDLELRCGLGMPVTQYAMVENALRHAEGASIATHAETVAGLWARLGSAAAGNPDAWVREPPDAAAIRAARMLAFPYTVRHASQWHVDQGAGLVLCSLATAERLGVPRSRWVFPHAVVDANHMLPLAARRVPHASPGFALAAARACAHAGCALADVRHLDLYSCFPSAVRVQLRELGIPAERRLSVTGGMACAGGPLNSYVLHALVAMARVLRGDGGSMGLVTAVSGILTKQGVSLWSTEPPPRGFRFDDVTAEARAHTASAEVVAEASGPATVAAYTVLYAGNAPAEVVLLCDLPDGRRTLRAVHDPALAALATREELCGRSVQFGADGDVAAAG